CVCLQGSVAAEGRVLSSLLLSPLLRLLLPEAQPSSPGLLPHPPSPGLLPHPPSPGLLPHPPSPGLLSVSASSYLLLNLGELLPGRTGGGAGAGGGAGGGGAAARDFRVEASS
ncbi:hypothetical protein EPR50_G00245070, partial [Perca flavescens]